jgi:aryl-alcohol dehydrogenase-like predicted oxidoreductase
MLHIEQRQLGASGITVPALGIGVWSWGDKGVWGYGRDYTQDDVAQAYKVCLDAGLNFFDTAEIYGKGESERNLGACLNQDGRPITIASKFAPLPNRFSARQLLDALDATLERLGVSSIDLYQIHWPYTFLSTNSLMDALAEAVRAGKIRSVGVSNYSAKLMREAHARLARHDIPLASNQVHYSLLHRKPEVNGVLDTCRELNVALIAYSPLEQGFLTGKYRQGPTDGLTPYRRSRSQFRQAEREKMEPLFQVMEEVAHAHKKSLGQVALNWLLARDQCIIPIPGAKNGRQAQENAGALGWLMSKEEVRRIGQAAVPWLK